MRAQSVAAMAGAERQRGRNALTAGYLGAAESIAGGIYQSKTVKTGTGTPSTPTVSPYRLSSHTKPSMSYSGKYRRAY